MEAQEQKKTDLKTKLPFTKNQPNRFSSDETN